MSLVLQVFGGIEQPDGGVSGKIITRSQHQIISSHPEGDINVSTTTFHEYPIQ